MLFVVPTYRVTKVFLGLMLPAKSSLSMLTNVVHSGMREEILGSEYTIDDEKVSGLFVTLLRLQTLALLSNFHQLLLNSFPA